MKLTYDEALQMKAFKHYCQCSGSHVLPGDDNRNINQPHASWCPQYEEYAEYRRALHIPSGVSNADFLRRLGLSR